MLDNMSIRLKQLRKRRGMTLQQVADIVGVGFSTVRKWEVGDIQNIKRDKIALLAKALHTSPAYLMGWEDEPIELQFQNIKQATKNTLPILGSVACGEPIFKPAQELYVECVDDITADFALFAQGDSMINANIHDGDVVFVKKCDMVDNGQIAVVIIDDEATLKRVYYNKEKQQLILHSENPNYQPLIYINEQLENIRIIGRAVFVQSLIQ